MVAKLQSDLSQLPTRLSSSSHAQPGELVSDAGRHAGQQSESITVEHDHVVSQQRGHLPCDHEFLGGERLDFGRKRISEFDQIDTIDIRWQVSVVEVRWRCRDALPGVCRAGRGL